MTVQHTRPKKDIKKETLLKMESPLDFFQANIQNPNEHDVKNENFKKINLEESLSPDNRHDIYMHAQA